MFVRWQMTAIRCRLRAAKSREGAEKKHPEPAVPDVREPKNGPFRSSESAHLAARDLFVPGYLLVLRRLPLVELSFRLLAGDTVPFL
jgi:hypothetical protein